MKIYEFVVTPLEYDKYRITVHDTDVGFFRFLLNGLEFPRKEIYKDRDFKRAVKMLEDLNQYGQKAVVDPYRDAVLEKLDI